MNIKNALLTGVVATGLLCTVIQPTNVFAEQPPLFKYQGENLVVKQIAQYDSFAGAGGTEILAYDEKSKQAFVTNGAKSGMDILSFETLKSGTFTNVPSKKHIALIDFGIENVNDITSVASHPTEDLIALSVVSNPKTNPGYIVLLKKDGTFITKIQVGSLPDMVTFTPDGKKILVANEGEPSDDYSADPEGSISIIDLSVGLDKLTAITMTFAGVPLDDQVRVSSKGTTLQQLEPEYISVTSDSKKAYVSLQENNAIATVDLSTNTITNVKGLGVKDYSLPGNELDGKNNGKIEIEKLPLLGFYMPDAIDTYSVGGKNYILTPNEGDSRDYTAYSEEKKISKIASKIQLNAANYKGYTQAELDQLVANGLLTDLADTKITTENGLNANGKYEALYTFGGRSFSIFDADTMQLVYDSGSEMERITAAALPNSFNISNDGIEMDKRSAAKGPEPETVVTGNINGVPYAFIALERISGVMVYNLTKPEKPQFVTFISSRDFSANAQGDVSPEGLKFISADKSPTGKALLAATHEISGTVAVYEFSQKPQPMVINKTHNLKNFKTKKLVIKTPNSLVNVEDTSSIHDGILVKASSSLKGTGLNNTKVTISATEKNAMIDFNGSEVKEVVIDNSNVKEIRGAENVKKWTVSNGVNLSAIEFYNVQGETMTSPSPSPLKLTVFSDNHLYDSSLGTTGKAFEDYLASDRKLLGESSAVLESAVNDIKKSDSDIVLLSGDLTKDGERINHQKLANVLKDIEATGKKVYVIDGNHDILNPNAVKFSGDTTTPVDYVTPAQFKEIYADFGYNEAIAKDPNSLSYVVEPTNDLRIIAIDSCLYDTNLADKYPKTAGSLNAERLQWVLNQIEDAKKKNKRIIGMMHHGVVPHFGAQTQFFPEYVLDNWQTVSEQLADAGLNIVFTGHFHAQDAVSKTTSKGNTIYDIETGSLVTYPSPYREVAISDTKLNIQTKTVTQIDFNTGGKTFPVYAKGFLEDGMKKLVPEALAAIYVKQGMPAAQAMQAAQATAQIQVAPQLDPSITVGSLIANAMIKHYSGDETMDPTTQLLVGGMMASPDPMTKMLGNAIMSIQTDLSPADNNLVIDLQDLTKQ